MSLGFGYSILDAHKREYLIHGNPFSVRCQLVSSDSEDEKQGSLLDDTDELRGLPTEIGLTISSETGLGTIGNTAEFLLDINDVKIGKPAKGWKLFYHNRAGEVLKFKVEENIEDKTIGVYRLQLSAIVSQERANRIKVCSRRGQGAI
jgi:hypothetical protein